MRAGGIESLEDRSARSSPYSSRQVIAPATALSSLRLYQADSEEAIDSRECRGVERSGE